jgi:hypothetical protein
MCLRAHPLALSASCLAQPQDTVPEIEDDLAVAAVDAPEIKLFGKWPLDDIQISDMSLQVSP